jgi:hypothetical protein
MNSLNRKYKESPYIPCLSRFLGFLCYQHLTLMWYICYYCWTNVDTLLTKVHSLIRVHSLCCTVLYLLSNECHRSTCVIHSSLTVNNTWGKSTCKEKGSQFWRLPCVHYQCLVAFGSAARVCGRGSLFTSRQPRSEKKQKKMRSHNPLWGRILSDPKTSD